jgi:hypothetical protein
MSHVPTPWLGEERGNAVWLAGPVGNTIAIGRATVTSSGRSFGDPGFYFTVHRRGRVWARYVRTMQESIRVFVDGADVRADHVMWLWGATFLRLHYRLRPKPGMGVLVA